MSGPKPKVLLIDDSLDTDATISILFTTPNTTKWAHWQLVAQSTGFCRIDVYENPTVSDAGTAVTAWNRNRNSATAATTVVTHTPTANPLGTKMITKYIGSATLGPGAVGGETRGDSEFILKQNEQYLVVATALDDGLSILIGGDWYEHTSKG